MNEAPEGAAAPGRRRPLRERRPLLTWPPGDAVLFAGVALIVFLTRLPFLWPGYGSDGDAWRIVRSGMRLAQTGEYHPSRLPGYPIPELSLAVLYHGGPWLTNGVTALLCGVAAAFFALVVRRLGSGSAALAALAGLALAFTPVVFVASVQTMDHVWALAFAMAALYALMRERPLLAGALLGAAAGCRPTALALFVPFLAYLLWPPRRPDVRRAILSLCGGGALVFLAAYAVVLISLSGHVLPDLAPTHRTWLATAIRGTFDVWGVIGVPAIVAALAAWAVLAVKRRGGGETGGTLVDRGDTGDALADRSRAPLTAMCVAALAVYALLYLRTPLDAAYLIPAVPFVLLLLARLPKAAFAAVCVALLVSPFFLTVRDAPAGARFPRTLGLRGRILTDHNRRVGTLRYVERIEDACRELPGPAVLVAGYYKPWLDVRDGGRVGACVVVQDVTPEELAAYRTEGVRIWYEPRVKDYVENMTGADLDPPNAQPLDLSP